MGYEKHFRVHHGNNEFARGSQHINGIESFWGYAKNRLVKFKGVPKHTFYLHLKETEFRFNHRKANLYNLTEDAAESPFRVDLLPKPQTLYGKDSSDFYQPKCPLSLYPKQWFHKI